MRGPVEDVVRTALLGDTPGVHDQHVVAGLRDHAEIVRDEDDGHPHLVLEFLHELQDLRLDGDVERRRRFVRDHQRRPAGQRHGDDHSLAHAAGKLVRIFADADLRRRDADLLEHLDGTLECGARRDLLVQQEGLGQLLADPVHRVQGRHGLLEDHADLARAHLVDRLLRHGHQVLAAEQDPARRDVSHGARQQPQYRQRGDALAAARLADDAERMARADLEAHAVHGPHEAGFGVELDGKVLHVQQDLAAGTGAIGRGTGHRCRSRADRSCPSGAPPAPPSSGPARSRPATSRWRCSTA